MTSFLKSRYLRIAGFATGAVAVSGAAVLVTASAAGYNVSFRPSSSQPALATTASVAEKANTSALCNSFISHRSSRLGKTSAQLNDAFQKAMGDTLAEEVKNGGLTQTQADAISKKLGSQQPCALTAVGRLGDAGPSATIGAYMPQLVTAAASALGVSETQLKADLASGKSLSDIAGAKNPPVTEAQFRTNLIAKLKPLLDTAVTSKKLTTTQEQEILQRLQKGPIPMWNKSIKHKTTAPATAANA
jgi:hypothetical protein